MNISLKAGFATATLAVALLATPAMAADLGGGYGKRGSIKDSGYEPAPMARDVRGPAGNCYFRGDMGYSVSRDPSVKWAVTDNAGNFDAVAAAAAGGTGSYDAATNTYTAVAGADPVGFNAADYYSVVSNYLGDSVSNTRMENAWFGGVGIGCGSGSRGFRGELALGYTGHRKIDGKPIDYNGTPVFGTAVIPVFDDPLHTGVKSYTGMVNAYYDFGQFGGITPYLGAGVGMSYNRMSEVYFTDNVNLVNKIQGDSRLSLAWSLMGGIGWQVSDRAILDLGYRYMNYGAANSGVIDSAGFKNPAVHVDNLSAHEFRVGLRYHFGSSGSACCDAPAYQPMK
jgi:opacity protein-like surface antigen